MDVTSVQTRLRQRDASKIVNTMCYFFFVEKEIQSDCSSLDRRKCKEEIQSGCSLLDRRKCKEEIQSDWSSLGSRKCKARVFFMWLNSRLAIKT